MIGFFHENEKYGCFSNWYPAEFDYVHHFTSSEQFMMYHKVLMFRRYDLAEQILQTSDPAECKKIAGQKFPEFNADIWEKTCYTIVKRGVKAKFAQNKDILRTLLDTGNELLAECSPYDKKWGVGIDIGDPERLTVAKWKGQNLLGRILMEVREELREEIALSPDGQIHCINAMPMDPIPEWNKPAGELQRIPQYHNAIHAFSDTLQDQHIHDCFLYDYSLQDWDIAMQVNMGGGLTIIGFYEMKQEVYDIAHRLSLLNQKHNK